jgi:hypothetical protein
MKLNRLIAGRSPSSSISKAGRSKLKSGRLGTAGKIRESREVWHRREVPAVSMAGHRQIEVDVRVLGIERVRYIEGQVE